MDDLGVKWTVCSNGHSNRLGPLVDASDAKCLVCNGRLSEITKSQEASINAAHMTFTDGYVGSMGKTWETPTADDLERCIVGAMEIEQKSRAEIVALLEAGKFVRWCQSPNYYYDHSYGKIGRRQDASPARMVMCDCGHEVPAGTRMSASLGTSCPDCYDRMSD